LPHRWTWAFKLSFGQDQTRFPAATLEPVTRRPNQKHQVNVRRSRKDFNNRE
jgi:hypothetical protein